MVLNSDPNGISMVIEGYTSGCKFKDWWNNLWGNDTNNIYVRCIWHSSLGGRRVEIYHQDCLTLK